MPRMKVVHITFVSVVLVLCFIIFFSYSRAVADTPKPSSPRTNAPPVPAQAPLLQGDVATQPEINELNTRVDALEKELVEKSGSPGERLEWDIATLGTYVTIIVTVVGLVAAIIGTLQAMGYFQNARERILTEASKDAQCKVGEVDQFIRGTTSLTQAIICAHSAWDWGNHYQPTSALHLSTDALDAAKYALATFNKMKTNPSQLFKERIDELIIRSTNNLVLYTSLAKESCPGKQFEESALVKHAQELKAITDFDKFPYRANTYILARIIFKQSFALAMDKSEAEIATETDRELALQEKRKLNSAEKTELEWIRTKLAN